MLDHALLAQFLQPCKFGTPTAAAMRTDPSSVTASLVEEYV